MILNYGKNGLVLGDISPDTEEKMRSIGWSFNTSSSGHLTTQLPARWRVAHNNWHAGMTEAQRPEIHMVFAGPNNATLTVRPFPAEGEEQIQVAPAHDAVMA